MPRRCASGWRRNCIRIGTPSVRTGKAPRFGREPEAGACFRGPFRRVRRRLHLLPSRMDLRGWLRPGLSRWRHRDSPAMIRRTDRATIAIRARNMAPVSLPTRRRPFRRLAHGRLVVAAVDVAVAPVGELAREGARDRRGAGFPADAALRPGVEPSGHGLAASVHLPGAPAAVMEAGQRLDAEAAAVGQRCRQTVFGVPRRVPDEADAEAPAPERGLVPGGAGGDGEPGLAGGDEGVEGRVGVLLDAEDEVQPALPVGQRHRERPVSAVVDGHVALGGAPGVREGGPAPVPVGGQVEVDGDAVAQPVQDADHSLGMVGAVGHAEAVVRGFPRQGDPPPVDGEDPAALPGGTVGASGEDLPARPPERGLAGPVPHRAGRRCRGRTAPGARTGWSGIPDRAGRPRGGARPA